MTNSPVSQPSAVASRQAASFFARSLTRRQKMTWRLVAVAIMIAIVGTSLTYAAISAGEEAPVDEQLASPNGSTRPRALEVGVVEATQVTSFQRARVYTGTLVAKRRSTLAMERAGRVIKLHADLGDRVAAGQVLAQLDTRRSEAQLAVARAELAQAEAVLAELQAGPRKQTIDAARAQLETLAAQRDLARVLAVRRKRLVATRSISDEEYDEARYALEAAVARTEAARQALNELEAGTRPEQIEAQRAAVAAAEARAGRLVARHRRRQPRCSLRRTNRSTVAG